MQWSSRARRRKVVRAKREHPLREISVAHGNGWEAEVAKAVGVDPRLNRRGLNGTASIPDAVWPTLRERLQGKLVLDALIERLG